jgi:uncharacterized protein involved in exopolysaccharide biosynthesis
MTSGFVYNKSTAIQLPTSAPSDNATIGLRDVAFFLRMRWRWILLSAVGFVGLAIVYVSAARPVFVADTQLIVIAQVTGSETQRASAEDAFIEAQIEIANSNDVLGATALSLNLVDDPDFQDASMASETMSTTGLTSLFRTEPEKPAALQPGVLQTRSEERKKLDGVVARLRSLVGFRRIGRSMILQISASAFDPEKAATIANSLAEEYIRKNVGMNGSAAQQYSAWLEGYLAEQQRGLAEAANALLIYKSNPREQFKLAELQSAADARRALFENTLTRLTETKQRISYPVSDATIVSQATPPLSKARPRGGLIVAFAGAVGLTVGLMAAMIRHAGDRRIISPRQLAKATTVPFALLVEKSRRTRRIRAGAFVTAFGIRRNSNFPTASGMGELSTIVAGLRRRQRSVIGIVAVDSGSGATTIASELAILSALSGSQTLLVDAAALTAGLSKWISPEGEVGISDIIEKSELLPTASLRLSPTLRFLPLGKVGGASPAIRLSSRRTQVTISDLKKTFDTVIIDLTAFDSSSDANALGPELDGALVVSCYGRTSIDEATRAIESMRNVGTEILGVVINKTPKRWL